MTHPHRLPAAPAPPTPAPGSGTRSGCAPGEVQLPLWRALLRYLRPYLWPDFSLAVLCMAAFGASNGMIPLLVRYLFDHVFARRDPQLLQLVPPVLIGAFLARGLLQFASTYLGEAVGQRIGADIRAAANRKLQHLPEAYFDQHKSGYLVSRIMSDSTLVRQALVQGGANVIKDSLSLLVLMGVAIAQDWRLALMAFVVAPLTVVPILRLSRRLRQNTRRVQSQSGDLAALLLESTQGRRVVKGFGMQQEEIARFERENDRVTRSLLRSTRLDSLSHPLMELTVAVGMAAVVVVAGRSVMDGSRTAGSFVAYLVALGLLYDPFKRILKANNLIQQGLGAGEHLMAFLAEPEEGPQQGPPQGPQPLCPAGGRTAQSMPESCLRFDNVSFRYRQDERWVLRHFNLEVTPGAVVALVGSSGAGKSTVIDLIPRFYLPQEGRILLHGQEINTLNLAALRQQLALVSQHTYLFNASVRANIAYGKPGASDAAVEEAARLADADGFIRQLAEGYETRIGEHGLRLSGGQRQRIAIARALLKDAPILLLDEATSALDNLSERSVQRALDDLMRQRTTLVVAHRLSTIVHADRIVVLEQGQIVEEGPHQDLLARGGAYRQLHDLQFRRRRDNDKPRAH